MLRILGGIVVKDCPVCSIPIPLERANPKKGLLLQAFTILILLPLFLLVFRSGASAAEPALDYTWNLREGQEVSPFRLKSAVSLSAGKKLSLDDTSNLFFSNVPEFPTEPGILCRVGDVLPPSGKVRVHFSHMNLLIDWTTDPLENMPAVVGFAVENQTSRTLDIYAGSGAMGCSRAPDGTYLFTDDAAPPQPGESEPQYYGSAVGNYVVREFFLSEERPPVHLGRVQSGGRLIISGEVGPKGWAAGIYDLSFIDAGTGLQVGRNDLPFGETVGMETFIAPLSGSLDAFLDNCLESGTVLRPGPNDCEPMRGLFIPGVYPDSPGGGAVSRGFTVTYLAREREIASFALASGDAAPEFEVDVFLNDGMRNGLDPASPDLKGVNKGCYGVDYRVDLQLEGPVALVFQGAMQPGYVDVYNQISTVWLDGRLKAVQIKDPLYSSYYTNPYVLRPPGYGRVIAVFPEQGRHDHLLRFIQPPNNYGPVRFYLLPLKTDEIPAND